VDGVRVGHWTDSAARTGCTVVLLPDGTTGSAEVRGGAPASRELDALVPGRLVNRVDAVLLTGGSAFGLAAADGVMRWCEERSIGFATPAGPVPIVPALGLFDLGVGDGSVRPGPDDGYRACVAATSGACPIGAVGAGTGATVGKWRGPDHVRDGGLGTATVRQGDLVVGALVAVNAFGDVDRDGTATADPDLDQLTPFFGNTTIGVIATNATLDPPGCLLVAQGGHDGLARSLFPVHTRADGDAFVAVATGRLDAPADIVRAAAVIAVERAVRSV
jgi:L-aminopeptidase/D-esterase-like protein